MAPAKLTSARLEEEIRDYIVDAFLGGDSDDSLQMDDDLLTILNSLQLLRMVLELESRYGIAIPNDEISPETLRTVERLAALVADKCR